MHSSESISDKENLYYWDDFIKDIKENLRPGHTLLDAGAGDCRFKNYFPDVNYIGMDLGVAVQELDYSLLNIKGDLRNIPLEDKSVDTIICIQVLEHLPEPWKVLGEFNRILKKDGYLFISCPQSVHQHQVPYDFFRYTPFGLTSLLENNGFEVAWIKPQLGNFNHIFDELRYSVIKLPELAENLISKKILWLLSIYVRTIFAIHRPLLLFFDRYKKLQDNPVGHFSMSQKI
jgi:ubiquinone/menaquinone biosynthesis C-methylase UbiE